MKLYHVFITFLIGAILTACAVRVPTLVAQDNAEMHLAKVGIYADWVQANRHITQEPKLFVFGQGGRTCTAIINKDSNGEINIRKKSCI